MNSFQCRNNKIKKTKTNRSHLILIFIFYILILGGVNRTNQFNETYQSGRLWYNHQIQDYMNNLTSDNPYEIENELTRLNYSLELNRQSIFYNILRYAPYYYFMVYLI